MEQVPHIVILPSPGMGHLVPLAELAKQLALRHHLFVTFIVPTVGPPPEAQEAILESLVQSNINCISLPEITFEDLPPGVQTETKICLAITRSIAHLRDVFKALVDEKRSVHMVVDIFGTDAFDIAKEFNFKPYVYFIGNATGMLLLFALPKLDISVSCEYKDMKDPVQLTESVQLFGSDFPDPLQDRTSNAHRVVLHHAKRYRLAEGIIFNSFLELEPEAIKILGERELNSTPIYPIGPMIQTGSLPKGLDGTECLRWLDDQPHRSVLFVSFGSGGTLSYEQLSELALGLEMSQKRFIWVVRSPNDEISNGTFFNIQSHQNPLKCLPNGFLDRTNGLGLVVPNWAPQGEILSHGSTGGFLTHCGWNSIMESIVHGVPLIAWPLYAEQKLNAVLLVDGLNVALRPNIQQNGLVTREEIAKVVKGLLDGEEGKTIGKQMNELKNAAAKALSDTGSSAKSLSNLLLKWK